MKRLTAILILLAMRAFAETHYVSLNGTNNSPYLNWADASTNVQWAVDAAVAGDTVLISNGTYYLTNQVTIAQDSITVQGIDSNYNSVLLVGCPFAGQTEGVTSRVMRVAGSNAFISGVTITNGQTTNSSASNVGAGIWATGASLTMSNCLVAGNYSAAGALGGTAVFINNSSEHLVHSCVISNNSGTVGGNASAVHVASGKFSITNSTITRNISLGYTCGTGSTSIFDNCTISANGSRGSMTLSCVARINNCLILANTNTSAGCGIIASAPNIIISNCVVRDNISSISGGNSGCGIYVNAAASGIIIANSSIYGNRVSASGGLGAGILLLGSGTVKNCVISNNYSGTTAGGAGLGTSASNSIVQNCLFVNNYNNALGGAIYVTAAATNNNFYNCTIISNRAGANGGGGVYFDNATNYFYNCIIYSNTVASGVGADVLNNKDGTASFNYCTSSSNLTAFGPGNITTEPLWADWSGRDFRQLRASPCVDTGTNLAWMTGATDLDDGSNLRIWPSGGTVDMGCYELQYSTFTATILRMAGITNGAGASIWNGTAMDNLRGVAQ